MEGPISGNASEAADVSFQWREMVGFSLVCWKEMKRSLQTLMEREWAGRIAEKLQKEDVSEEHPWLFVKQFLSNF